MRKGRNDRARRATWVLVWLVPPPAGSGPSPERGRRHEIGAVTGVLLPAAGALHCTGTLASVNAAGS